MKPLSSSADLFKTHLCIKIAAFTVISVTFFYLGKHWSNGSYQQLIFFSNAPQKSIAISPNSDLSFNISSLISQNESMSSPLASPPPVPAAVPPPPPESPQTFGIIDSNGQMNASFDIGDFDPDVVDVWGNETVAEAVDNQIQGKIKKFELCPESMREYIPCLDNVEAIKKLKSTEKGEKFERHCPEKGKELSCLVPPPKGYRPPIPWPRSRDEVFVISPSSLSSF